MKRVTSADFQKNFGQCKREALSHPISICIHGKDTLVVMSHEHFEKLSRSEPVAASVGLAAPSAVDDLAHLEIIATAGYDDLKAPTSD